MVHFPVTQVLLMHSVSNEHAIVSHKFPDTVVEQDEQKPP